ncbi:lipoprotein [Spiroplasma cantharicola]|uniref:Lipoprotein n=1 Tax=Spiroplasma cantharicola TaxID=362837 RepID=A0A0M4JSK8_9MOLU|nr:lipoprotein [Spiroplasma cantharicola]ALD66560.1 hypothetical protein SCANT_v1c06540 [Spiroplasma cantharicola]
MKKLLSLLGTISLVTTSSATVVACGEKTEPPDPIINNEALIKEFKIEVENIFQKHLDENVYKNLIGLPDTEIKNKFLNQTKIIEYTGAKASEIDQFDLQQLEHDIKNVLDIDILTKELNKLKNINKYKIILNDVNNLFKNLIIEWDSLVIKSYQEAETKKDEIFLGNVIVNYKIVVNYKGEKDIESFELGNNMKYTSTNNTALKVASDDFYQNIAKDYFLSSKAEDRKHTNIKWNNINSTGKKEYDGFGIVESEFEKYFEIDSNTNGFKDSMIEFIKSNYFEKVGNTLPLSFEGDLIYKSSEMKKYSLLQTINKWETFYNQEDSIKFDYKNDKGRLFLETVFRKDPNLPETKNSLSTYYFTKENYEIWKTNFDIQKDNFLKELKIDKEKDNFIETDEYKKSINLGYINLTGLSINLAEGSYIHELPDFRIAINYLIGDDQTPSKDLSLLSEFTVDTLKAFHKMFGVSHAYEYPEYNSKDDFLMTLKRSELTDAIVDKFYSGHDNSGDFVKTFSLFDSQNLGFYRQQMFDEAKLPDSEYFFGFSNLAKKTIWVYNNWFWKANKKVGINISWRDISGNRSDRIMTFQLGYLNFHIDLDQITLGAKEVGNKELIKFI